MVRCIFKEQTPEKACHAQILLTILSSIVNIIRGPNGLLKDHCHRTLMVHNTLRLAPKLDEVEPGFFRNFVDAQDLNVAKSAYYTAENNKK